MSAPLVSIMISTFNRSKLLRRAVASVLGQDFGDLELVIIDDASSDDTKAVVESFGDPRIRYVRNDVNVGSRVGDREHIRRFVYELMRGKYFVYLCDDDYWIFPDHLGKQVAAFKAHDNVALVTGGQLTYFLSTPDSYFGRTPPETMTFTKDNIGDYFDFSTGNPKSHHLSYFPKLYTKPFLTSGEYLDEFADEPTKKNRIVGCVLYSREHFVRAGALNGGQGSQWQAGYELLMGPGCYGNIVYLDEPSIAVEARASNASFQRTQVQHFLDSVTSIEAAFVTPLAAPELKGRRDFIADVKARTIRNLGRVYLTNTIKIKRDGALGLCSVENMATPVTYREIIPALYRNGALNALEFSDLGQMAAVEFPWRLEAGLRKIALDLKHRLKS
jgi:glycosyltransferase involved in cell wall biosynthesis